MAERERETGHQGVVIKLKVLALKLGHAEGIREPSTPLDQWTEIKKKLEAEVSKESWHNQDRAWRHC